MCLYAALIVRLQTAVSYWKMIFQKKNIVQLQYILGSVGCIFYYILKNSATADFPNVRIVLQEMSCIDSISFHVCNMWNIQAYVHEKSTRKGEIYMSDFKAKKIYRVCFIDEYIT